jgi:hypothetical protein
MSDGMRQNATTMQHMSQPFSHFRYILQLFATHYDAKRCKGGAAEKTRTSTGVTPQRPQRCASTIPPQPHAVVGGHRLDKDAELVKRQSATKCPAANGQRGFDFWKVGYGLFTDRKGRQTGA